MPPQLPVELLRVIIHNFRLPPFSSPHRTECLEAETRQTLCSLCLSSRVFLEIAQPLLFGFVRINEYNAIRILSRLIDNSGNDRLTFIRKVFYEDYAGEYLKKGERKVLKSLLGRFYSLASEVEEVVICSDYDSLQSIPGMSFRLKRLFLHRVRVNWYAMSYTTFPSLEVLGFCCHPFDSQPPAATTFPSLRHLIFDSEETHQVFHLEPFLATLDSIILRPDSFLEACSAFGTKFPIDKVLVNWPWFWPLSDTEEEEFVVNLRLLLPHSPGRGSDDLSSESDELSSDSDELSSDGSDLQEVIDYFTSCFEDEHSFPRLETIYLPPVDPLAAKYDRGKSQAAFECLVSACRERNVEVILEEQSETLNVECQLSDEFMKRMTRKRITRESEQS
ncbi:uncharacterized protein JCM6883_003534 [Sporobolomyces salmoneus]|uniref:uncharacterized protein n=1 Tax=Sporobolomyces salmoneus TaxID=183962 RepID=UPI003174615B